MPFALRASLEHSLSNKQKKRLIQALFNFP
nr:MAG TPA: hypothetical protein [Caudoviricetes sp.]